MSQQPELPKPELIPNTVYRTIAFALVHVYCTSADGVTMTEESRERAWKWIEDHRADHEDMGQ